MISLEFIFAFYFAILLDTSPHYFRYTLFNEQFADLGFILIKL